MDADERSRILAATARYYSDKASRHGATASGVDWRDAQSHRLRHRQFMRLLEQDVDASVADVGCGYGDFLSFCRAHGHRGRYLGCDISETMLALARAQHGTGADRQWHLGPTPPMPSDYAIASGLFNVRQDASAAAWAAYMDETIGALARASRRGFGFNVLTSWSDPDKKRDDLYYADPLIVLESCRARFGRHISLLHDYGLWEFTVLIRHQAA